MIELAFSVVYEIETDFIMSFSKIKHMFQPKIDTNIQKMKESGIKFENCKEMMIYIADPNMCWKDVGMLTELIYLL